MEIDGPVPNEPGGVDDATAALILQLQYQDIEELLGTRKGKGRDGEQSDADLAMATYQKELQDRITILADRSMSRSLTQAIVSDATILSESRAQENTAVKDRALALRLAEGKTTPVTSEQTTAEDALDDSIIARLAALYVPGRSEDAPQDDDVAGAESSAWAGSRKKPSAVVHRRCTACDSEKSLFDVFRAPCGHDYCKECLSDLFQLATTDETLFPPRCCRQEIPLQLVKLYLSSTLFRTFEKKSIEFKSSNRTYCCQPTCSSFIPSDDVSGERATCTACGAHTCTICKNNAHDGDCPKDAAIQQLLETGREQGWQRCYHCRRLVELDMGCNHITCPCGAQFWYLTLPWSPRGLLTSTAMFVAHAGNPVIVRSGTKIASPPVQTKSLPAILLQLGSPENDNLLKLMPISENVMTAHILHGVMSADHTNVKNVITTFRNIFLSVSSAELWSATGADVIDYETLIKSV